MILCDSPLTQAYNFNIYKHETNYIIKVGKSKITGT